METEKREIKNLATCSNVEFLVQTNKIRKSVQDWLKIIDFAKIRKNLPTLVEITDDMTEEQKKAAETENKKRKDAQLKKNLSDMIDSALETNAEKTAEVLGLVSFVEPEDIRANKVKMPYLIRSFFEMLNDEDVLGFFSSLIRSELISILQELKP